MSVILPSLQQQQQIQQIEIQPNQFTGLPKGIALYNFFSTDEEELTLEEGDIIDIIEEADDGWWKGVKICGNIELNKEGICPYNYIKKLSTLDFYQLCEGKSPRLQYVHNILKLSQSKENNIQKQQHQQHQQQHQQQQEQEQEEEEQLHQKYQNYNGNQFKDSTHIIASLSDPLEKRGSIRNSDFLDQQIEEQREQDELLKLQREQIEERNKQNNSGGGGITIRLNDIAKEGFLIKKGHIRRNWNVRWFQLKRNILTYSKTPNDIKLSGTIILSPESEIDIATNMKRTNCFQIKNQSFIFYCSSQSQSDMESWITALNTAKVCNLKFEN
ncbi:hypothetical protein ACTFIR_011941 [Dictyostelium discoideum]